MTRSRIIDYFDLLVLKFSSLSHTCRNRGRELKHEMKFPTLSRVKPWLSLPRFLNWTIPLVWSLSGGNVDLRAKNEARFSQEANFANSESDACIQSIFVLKTKSDYARIMDHKYEQWINANYFARAIMSRTKEDHHHFIWALIPQHE